MTDLDEVVGRLKASGEEEKVILLHPHESEALAECITELDETAHRLSKQTSRDEWLWFAVVFILYCMALFGPAVYFGGGLSE